MASSSKGGGKGGGGSGGGGSNPLAGQDMVKIFSLTAGGALVGAAVMFGVKKIYDYLASGPVHTVVSTPISSPVTTPEFMKSMPDVVPEESATSELLPRIEVTCEGDAKPVEGGCSGAADEKVSSETGSPDSVTSDAGSSPSHGNTLYKQLLLYHADVCSIPEATLAQAQDIRDELLYLFGQYIGELLPNLPVRALHCAAFDPQVTAVHSVEVRIPLDLNPDVWTITEAGDSVLAAHGHCFVRRHNLEFFSPGTSRYDKYTVAGYLAPQKVTAVFQELTHRVGKWGSGTSMEVKAAVVGPYAQLMVYRPGQPPLHVNFIPEVTLGDKTVVAKGHPLLDRDTSYENLWQCCYGDESMNYLKQTSGCQLICLQLLLGLQYEHPLLAELGRQVAMATILHLLDQEEDWSEAAMCERFIDSLKFIETSCRKQKLYHPLDTSWNLLQYAPSMNLSATAHLIKDVIEHKNYDWLLQAGQPQA